MKINIAKLEKKCKDLIKEYPEQSFFHDNFELIFMLDEIQTTTEKVLSLEEERLRLRNERRALEEKKRNRRRMKN